MTFDADTHTYRDKDGREHLSVTTIISEVWPIDKRWYKEGSTNFGTEVHELSALIDRGDANLEDFAGTEHYLALHAWSTFLQRTGGDLVAIETPFIHLGLSFAGTLDRVLNVNNENILIDLKTGKPEKWHELQLGGYAVGAKAKLGITIERAMTVHLRKEGGAAKPVIHDIEAASQAWVSLMRWRGYRGLFK